MASEARRIRWLVEAVVIVGSILLAFAIDAWWDQRQDRQMEAEILGRLLSDFSANSIEVNSQLSNRRRLSASASDLLAAVAVANLGDGIAVPTSAVINIVVSPTFDPVTSTMDAAFSSGQAALIRNMEVAESLADWRRIALGLHENELAVRDVVHRLVAPALFERNSVAGAMETLSASVLGEVLAPAEDAAHRLVVTEGLEGAIGLYLFNSSLVERDLVRLGELCTRLIAALEAEAPPYQ